MNHRLPAVLIILVTAAPLLADSVKLTETYADKLVVSRQDGVTSYDTVTADSGSFTCSLTLPGLKDATFTDQGNSLSFSVGSDSFSAAYAVDAAGNVSRTAAIKITVKP